MKLVCFKMHNGNDAWVNPEMVSYIRQTLDGEQGRSLIWMEGSGIFVDFSAAEVAVKILEGS